MGNRYLVVSDLHLADAEDHADGWKAYKHSRYFFDDAFDDLLGRFVSRSRPGDSLTLILNGDILDFDIVTAVPDPAPWPVSRSEHRTGLEPTEERSVWKTRLILAAHPVFLRALAGFLQKGHRMVFLMGNHDREVHFPSVQKAIRDAIGPVPDEAIRFEPWFYYVEGEIYVEHGQQYDYYSSFRTLLCPLIDTPGGPAVALPMGNLSGRHLTNRMGFFNPHATDFILNAFQYLTHWLKFYAFTRRSLARNWFAGSLVSLGRLIRIKQRQRRNPPDCDGERAAIAARFGLNLGVLNALESLERRPITDRVFRVIREFWLDRVLMALLMTGGTIALALVPIPLWIKLMVPLTAFPLIYFIYESAVSGESLSTYERGIPDIARRIADLLDVRVVTMGHTHKPRLLPLRKGLTFVDTGTWAPIMKRLETWRLEPGFRDYLELTFRDGEPEIVFESWLETAVQVRRVSTEEDLAACRRIRREVFVDGLGGDAVAAWEASDDDFFHFLVLAGPRPVGTARLRIEPEKMLADRIALSPARRDEGVARRLVRSLEELARAKGRTELMLEVIEQDVPRFEVLGYVPLGDPVDSAGIPCRRMRRVF
ncbi:MAG: GNAT family N-acetyltransferase [Deltaproteobacteria bacterium]|nr:GNAT family N-acetyltransferase [Deltaproteobacteria bacterium]